MPPDHVIYQNWQWNLPLAFYMALRGIAALALLPILIVYATVPSDGLALALMVGLATVGAAIPFARTMTAKVWISERHLHARNPFRTVTMPLDEIDHVTSRALWQNFFTVAAVHRVGPGTSRSVKVIAVPSIDVGLLEEALRRAAA